jgi:hypothetical protein
VLTKNWGKSSGATRRARIKPWSHLEIVDLSTLIVYVCRIDISVPERVANEREHSSSAMDSRLSFLTAVDTKGVEKCRLDPNYATDRYFTFPWSVTYLEHPSFAAPRPLVPSNLHTYHPSSTPNISTSP